ncbi:uncharacterized protein HD556DRAFT_1450035 [Suillus plorans]|uniref:Uncharacterized protein n=1 Tax=Suillus plorans TaxID=116603 RepID=A0A9P7ABI2_9AGAM|nr:uncharacterized protein HD556DRAFT_1450035 [Suillus plorans]KAG1786054.1 hypothetical protein HD556DRAFT_1450035 [Suillus plorans]
MADVVSTSRINLTLPIFPNPSMSDWYVSFEEILDEYKEEFLEANNPQSTRRHQVLCNARDAIVEVHKSQNDPVDLPKALKMAIRHYYFQFITDENDRRAEEDILRNDQGGDQSGVSPEEREANARPKDASFYKKQLTDWDVAQKLFRQEIDDYDKEEQRKMGITHSIRHRTGHARQWFNNMTSAQKKDVQRAKDKWNEEGAPAESQAMYRKRNLKKILDNFSQEIARTMGCRIIMLVSHKKSGEMSLGVSIHESEPVTSKKAFTVSSRGNKEWVTDGFKKFSEWSKQEFYPADDDEDDDAAKEEEEEKPSLPEVVLDNDGFAKLPSRTDVPLKGQQELIRQIFHASYKVFTGSNKPVPWGVVIADPVTYVDLDCVPKDFVFKDPSHMRAAEVNKLWRHWDLRRSQEEKLVVFYGGRVADLSKAWLANAIPMKKAKKKMYVEIDGKNAQQSLPTQSAAGTEQPASSQSTKHPEQPADHTSLTMLAGSRPTKHMKMPAGESDSSDDDLSLSAPEAHLQALTSRPSSAQRGAPAAVPMKDRMSFLRALSSNSEYLHFVEPMKDLKKERTSQHPEGWPTWATWSWERLYLPKTMHDSDDQLLKFLQIIKSTRISASASAMRVALGLGMLLRECKRVIEYEADEAAPDIPSYISTSVLDIKCLDLILDALNAAKGGVVRMSKARVDTDLKGAVVRHGAVPEELGQNALGGGQEGEVGMAEQDNEETRRQLEEELKKMAVLKEQMRKLKESKKMLEDSNKMLEKESADLQKMYHVAEGQKDREDEEQHVVEHGDVEKQDTDEERVQEEHVVEEKKGKKRRKSGVSGPPAKKSKTDLVRRSFRARQPSKKALCN